MKRIKALERRVNDIFGAGVDRYSQLMKEVESYKSIYIRLQENRVRAYSDENGLKLLFDKARFLREWEKKVKPGIVQREIEEEKNRKPLFNLDDTPEEWRARIDKIMNNKEKLPKPDYIK